MDQYEKLEIIGQGTYGKVYKGKLRATGQMVALKKTHAQYPNEGIPTSTLREIANLKLLFRCENIVQLLGVETKQRKDGKLEVIMVFECMDCDLYDFIHRYSLHKKPIPPRIVKNLMYQLVKGIEYCHRHRVIHRDLKPQNLLLKMNEGLLKVADMGLGRVIHPFYNSYTNEVVTLWYRAPELLLGDKDYCVAIDMWAIGCIFAELHTMRPFFEGDCDWGQLMEIFQKLGTPNDDVWPGVTKFPFWNLEFPKFRPKGLRDALPNLDDCGYDLLQKMLQYEPSKRISARSALSHPYFFELRGGNYKKFN